MAFAFETVFSHWARQPDGSFKSKLDLIKKLQARGYVVALLFVGLASPELSIARVKTRVAQGGHDVNVARLRERFPRTQLAVKQAASVADVTLMFDNSQDGAGFKLVLLRTPTKVTFDARDSTEPDDELALVSQWLDVVAPRS